MTDFPKLKLGHFLDHPATPVEVSTPDIAFHTAILAQSGAGKSFFLGRLVEEILLKTQAHALVLDSNGDFRNAYESEPLAWPTMNESGAGRHAEYRTAEDFQRVWDQRVRMVQHREQPDKSGTRTNVHWHKPRIDWSGLDFHEKAAVLGLSARESVLEIYILTLWEKHCREARVSVPYPPADEELAKFVQECAPPDGWGRERWETAKLRLVFELSRLNDAGDWLTAANDTTNTHRAADAEATFRLQVLDLPSVQRPEVQQQQDAQLLMVWSLLRENWRAAVAQWEVATQKSRSEDRRVPLFIVIDEAHNFIPDAAGTALQERVAESIHRIAAEGRKYGIFLILATQRPAKVRRGLLAECENVCLLRLQSPVDHEAAHETWGVPLEYVARAAHFSKGDGMLFGRWVPSTTFFHSAWRRTKEGGASLNPDIWARPARAGDGEGQ